MNTAHAINEYRKSLEALRPIVESLEYLTRILPAQIDEVYENLLWIRVKVEKMTLDKTWVANKPSPTPDTSIVKTETVGAEEETHYLITVGSSETSLG